MGLYEAVDPFRDVSQQSNGKIVRENTDRTVDNPSANVAGAALNSGRKILVSDRGVPQM